MSFNFKSKKLILRFFCFYLSSFCYADIKYSLIFHIHGDHSYSYFNGHKRVQADRETYKKAKIIAQNCKSCEVLINWEKPKNLFYSAQALFYSSGKLIDKVFYNRDYSAKDIEIYQKYSVGYNETEKPIKKIYLYFGHQIPETNRLGYSSSMGCLPFSTKTFAERLKHFSFQQKPQKPFAGIVLSTCNNGTVETIDSLSSLTDFVLASPESLHLSYFDLTIFSQLDNLDLTTEEVLLRVTKESFKKLKERVKTVVSIALYNTQKTREYILGIISNKERSDGLEYCDRGDLDRDGIYKSMRSKGVVIYYKPPKFGALKNKAKHTGWCATL